jgi:hypothetical protein
VVQNLSDKKKSPIDSRPATVAAPANDSAPTAPATQPAPASAASTYPKAESAPAPKEEKPGRGRPATAPRCQVCGLAQYACKCAKPAVKTVTIELNEATVRMMINFPWNLAGKILAYKAGYLYEEFGAVWKFTDEELDELVKPAKVVAEKYVPDFLIKYEAELNLVAAFTQVVMTKLMLISLTVKKKPKETGQAAATPPPTPKEKPGPSPAAHAAPAKNPTPTGVEHEFGSAAAFAAEYAGSPSL